MRRAVGATGVAVALASTATLARAGTEPPPNESPSPLPVRGSIRELRSLARSILGPTDDAVAELRPFARMPDGIPTPEGAVVTEFEFWAYPYSIGGYYSAGVTLITAAAPGDVVEFYETAMAGGGFEQIGDSVSNDDTARRTSLSFTNPTSGYEYAEVSVTISDSDLVAETRVAISFTDATTPSALAPFTAWTKGLPLPADGSLQQASMFVLDMIGRTMTLTVEYLHPGVGPLDAEDRFEAALPLGGYSIDDGGGADEEGITHVDSGVIDYGTVSFRRDLSDDPPGTLIDVSVTVSLDP